MSLAALTAAGAFVDPAPIETEVTWKGQPYRVWVVRQSAYALRKAINDLKAEGEQKLDQVAINSLMISLYLRFGDSTEQMTFEQALSLDPELHTSLEQCLNKVPEAPKASRPKKRSGTS